MRKPPKVILWLYTPYTQICTEIYTEIHTQAHKDAHTQRDIQRHTETQIHIYMHTHAHTHTHKKEMSPTGSCWRFSPPVGGTPLEGDGDSGMQSLVGGHR